MTSTILGSLTIVILGFAAFVGYKNKGMYEEKIQERRELDSANARKRKNLEDLTKEKNQTKENRLQREEEAVALGKVLEDQLAKNVTLEKQIGEKKDQIAEQKLKIDQLVEAVKDLGDIETLIPQVTALKKGIVQLREDLSTNETKLSDLIAEQNRTAGIVTNFETENAWRSAVTSNPELKTKIARMYESHGFVLLPVGNSSGVVGGSTLEVVRDGAVIAKLLVKAVETNTSTAEIIPGTLTPDTVLMQGDAIRSVKSAVAAAPVSPPAPVTLEEEPAKEEDAAPAVKAPAEAPAEDIFK